MNDAININNKNVKISVMINTYNEETHIYDCLSCVTWADEVILVDMYSEDKTVEIAQTFSNVKIFYHEKCGYVEPARQFALTKVTNDWVIMLDADERVSLSTIKHIRQIIYTNETDVIYLPRYNFVMGELLYCGYQSNDSLPRCFKKNFINFTPIIHKLEDVLSNARVTKINRSYNTNNPSNPTNITQYIGILHFATDGFEIRMDKLNRYTTIEAINIYEHKKKNITMWRILFNYPYRLLGNIIWRKGYKQLRHQFILLTTQLFYELATYAKFYYMNKYKSIEYADKINESYDNISKQLVAEYNESKHEDKS